LSISRVSASRLRYSALMTKWLLGVCCFLGLAARLCAAESGGSVLVVYNTSMPGSKDVAEHYAMIVEDLVRKLRL